MIFGEPPLYFSQRTSTRGQPMHLKTDNPNGEKKKQQKQRIESIFLKPLLGKLDILLADGNWTFLIWPHCSIFKKKMNNTAFDCSAI